MTWDERIAAVDQALDALNCDADREIDVDYWADLVIKLCEARCALRRERDYEKEREEKRRYGEVHWEEIEYDRSRRQKKRDTEDGPGD